MKKFTRSPLLLAEPHTGDNATHVGETLCDSRHGIVIVDLVFEVNVALVTDVDQGAEDCRNRHHAIAYGNLALLDLAFGEVLHVEIKETWSNLFDRCDRIGTRAHRMADIDTAADTGVHIFDCGKNVKR